VERRRIRLVSPDELPPGATKIVPHPGKPPYRSVIVVHSQEGLRAYWNVCRHLPIPLDLGAGRLPLQDGKLVCETHGATYRPEDGRCVTGPCEGEDLQRIEVERDADGYVYGILEGEDVNPG
jgi:nitrite reductase/ring-hydroxylating ferredoxin subunit